MSQRGYVGSGDGSMRIEQAAQARRRRALHHLERVRQQQQQRSRRLPGPAAVAAFGLALVCGWWWGSAPGVGRVEVVGVRGARHLSPQEIALASGVPRGARLAELDSPQIAARLTEHAWIREARVLALPSGRLLLDVVEREPVAVLAGAEPWAVDATGVPFAPAGELEGLPRIATAQRPAPGQPDPDLLQAAALARRLPQLGLPAPLEIGVAAPDDPEGLSLRLPGLAPRVVLGREDLEARLGELARLLETELPELGRARSLDLRFRDQAVLEGEPSPAETAQAAAARGSKRSSKTRPAG